MRKLRRKPQLAVLLFLPLAGIVALVLTQHWQVAVIIFLVVQAFWMFWLGSRLIANREAAQEVKEEQQRLIDSNSQLLAEVSHQITEVVDMSRLHPDRVNHDIDQDEAQHPGASRPIVAVRDEFPLDLSQDDSLSSDSHADQTHVGTIKAEDVLNALREITDRQIEATEAAKDYASLLRRTKQQVYRSARRQVETYGMLEFLEGRLVARMDQFLDEAIREFRKNRGEISTLAHRFDALEWSSAQEGRTRESGFDRAEDQSAYLYYLSYQIPREIEAAQQLQRVYRPEGLIPLLGGWALTPTGTLDIVNAISAHEAATVVECGSGTSTLWFALALRESGSGHVYALEHDPVFAEKTRETIAEQGLSSFATVIDAPIVEHDTESGPVDWYEISGLSNVSEIDVLVIDGPPKALGHLRGSTLKLLSGRLKEQADIFADDVNRHTENTMINNWLDQFDPLRTGISSSTVQAHLIWDATE